MQFSQVSVIGLGYIGLPTAAIIASRKVHVNGVDVSTKAVEAVSRGEVHIVEPGLEEMVKEAVKEGYLTASFTPEPAQVFFIAVPTPFKDGHQPDLSYIEAAANSIAPVLEAGNLVVLESTSPVGATERLAHWISSAREDLKVAGVTTDTPNLHVAHCPERVLPGKVLEELITNDRIIGGLTDTCSEIAEQVYRIFVEGECIKTNARTAEMAKLTENSFRDVNIAFANELSLICDQLDINVWELIKLANHHPRVNILQPGPGVGGHCIAVDPWFIVDSCPEYARLIRTARNVNDSKPEYVIEQIKESVANLDNPVVACFGLAFKPDIDDLRESPALAITQKLTSLAVGRILAVEPNIQSLPESLDGKVELCGVDEALSEADVIVFLVDHKPFKSITRLALENKVVIDTKGLTESI